MSQTINTWLNATTELLATADITTARLDALVLLEDCFGTNRALLLAHPETELTTEQKSVLDGQIARRAQHEPLAYIRGRAEFYGRVFSVDKNVLVPRPESEAMIEMLLNLPLAARSNHAGPTIIDIGTGSGALAITAKLEQPSAHVIATDISEACLDVARGNATQLAAAVEFKQGDLLQPLIAAQLEGSVLLCNLPYVPDGYHINQAARHEPRLALFSGADGLNHFRQLFEQLAERAAGVGQRPTYILAESLPEQHDALAQLAAVHGYNLQRTSDFIQLFS